MADVIARISGNFGVIKFSNPPLNFLTREMLEDFAAHLSYFYYNNDVRAIIVMGEGNAFSSK